MSKLRGDIQEIQVQLQHHDYKVKLEGMKKLISQMSAGKDYSGIFQIVIRCLEHPQIELKKLVYLYIINYSRKSPDDAIMVVNMFRKDIYSGTPLIKALALRTMGCLRVKQLNEYLIQPLNDQIINQDAYVRKSAIICVGKVYAINPELVETEGLLKKIQDLLNTESNANVLSSILIVLMDISQIKGESVLNLNHDNVKKVLIAINDCNEWGQIFILDCLVNYSPLDQKEAETICERIQARLQHINPCVVLSSIKVILNLIDFLPLKSDDQMCNKIEQPLMSLVNLDLHEIQYIVLKNIKAIYFKRPQIIQNHEKMFFCKFNEPCYIKLEKVQIITLICNTKNSELLLNELQEYVKDLDQDFVSLVIQSLQTIGQKNNKACNQAIQILINVYQNSFENSQKIVNEVIIAMHNLYKINLDAINHENSLQIIKNSIINLTDSKAKQAGVWIIGQFCDEIEESSEILQKYLDSFLEEDIPVQLQILTSAVKLFVKNPQIGQKLIIQIFQKAQEEVSNPDVRDRAYMYWRLLSSDPEYTKQIVQQENTCEYIQEKMDAQILDVLIKEIGLISSAQQVPGQKFFKQWFQLSKFILFQVSNSQNEALKNQQQFNLLEMDQNEQKTQSLSDNDDILEQQSKGYMTVVQIDQQGQKNNSGIQIQADLIKDKNTLIMKMKIKNESFFDLNQFKIQLKNNYFNYQVTDQSQLSKMVIQQDSEQDVQIQIQQQDSEDNEVFLLFLQCDIEYPFSLKFAIKCSLDLFYFTINDINFNFLDKFGKIDIKTFKTIWKSIPDQDELNKRLSNRKSLENIKNKLQQYNLFFIAQRVNDKKEHVYYFSVKDLASKISLIEIIVSNENQCDISIKSQNSTFSYFLFKYLEEKIIV